MKNLATNYPKKEIDSDDFVFIDQHNPLFKKLNSCSSPLQTLIVHKRDLSNRDYEQLFKEKARHVETINKRMEDLDRTIIEELVEAGIKYEVYSWIDRSSRKTEVPTTVLSGVCSWNFERAWKYWICSGPGIPPDKAEEFDKKWGNVCRVGGYGGGISPLKWYKGFGVPLYHVDTQEGLNAFVELLKSIYIKEEEN